MSFARTLQFLQLLSLVTSSAQAQTTTAAPEVVVLGAPHLRQRPASAMPVNVVAIRRALEAYKPDQVVIEWLHPSLDAATTFNYRALGDRPTLARLWGYSVQQAPLVADSIRVLLVRLADVRGVRSVRGALRRELGRALYLAGDETNAAYQWYRARADGAPDPESERLVTGLLDGHEGVEWGFAVAAANGLESITPFDYQGPDAGSPIWGQMVEAIGDTALTRIVRVKRSDSLAWKQARSTYDSLQQRFESQHDTSWVVRYGQSPGVRQYAAVWEEITWAQSQYPPETDGLTLLRWLQSREYESVERRSQLEAIPSITFGGFGARRLAAIMARNRHMVNFLMADAQKLHSKRVLVIVGAGHKFALEDMLRERGFQIRDSRPFTEAPSNK